MPGGRGARRIDMGPHGGRWDGVGSDNAGAHAGSAHGRESETEPGAEGRATACRAAVARAWTAYSGDIAARNRPRAAHLRRDSQCGLADPGELARDLAVRGWLR